jgi:hypothetical protein
MMWGSVMKVRIFILAPHRGQSRGSRTARTAPDGPLSSSRKEKQGGKTSAWITTGYQLSGPSGGSEGLKSVTLLVGRAHEVTEGRSRRPIRAEPPAIFPGTEFNQRYERLLRRTVEERSSEKKALRHLRGEDFFFAACRRFRPTSTGSPVALYRVALYRIVETAI